MPVLRRPPRPGGSHLPARQRIPPLITEAEVRVGDLHLIGRITGASNTTVLARLGDPDAGPYVVYKPISGERPLWDFPDGTLAGRERAAYVLSGAGGWDLVPPTVLRDGPRGPGMVQAWVGEPGEAESVVHVLRVGSDPTGLIPVLRAEDEDGRPALVAHESAADVRSLAVLDAVINNADRKGAHAFRYDGRLYAVDHGVTFHGEDKLRTVLWGWAGDPLPDEDVARLAALAGELDRSAALLGDLAVLLTSAEIAALRGRIAHLLRTRRHPEPPDGWPAIPWPPL